MIVKRRKSAPLNLYIAPELKAAAEKTAAADNRSLTSLIEKLLMEAASAAGFWPPAESGGKSGRRK